MPRNLSRQLKALFLFSLRYLRVRSGLWLRASLCLAIGLGFLFLDPTSNYDIRLKLRGSQTLASKQILLIEITEEEWIKINGNNPNLLRSLKEFGQLSDKFFWNTAIWKKLLTKSLKGQPSVIGVSFYFGENLRGIGISKSDLSLFRNKKIIWSTQLDNDRQPLPVRFSNSYEKNIGLNYFATDKDGIIRSFESPLFEVPHTAIKLSQAYSTGLKKELNAYTEKVKLINFQGPKGTYDRVSISDFFSDTFDIKRLKDKIIIIGGADHSQQIARTPLGFMSKAEVLANVVDSFIDKKWIQKLNLIISTILLVSLLFVCIQLMSRYPQSVSLVFLMWIGIGYSVLSLWTFDHFYFWIPMKPVLIQLVATYIVFLSFQLTVSDYEKWQLAQERKVLLEVEQLKNNFVSLFSHDLKNPIAKIQAICDRLLAHNPTPEVVEGIQSLREESAELHRYIQKILQISRVEARDFKILKDSEDLNQIASRAISQLTPLIKDKNLTMETNMEPMFLIEVDKNLIYEVILNLIDNAIKYSPKGGKITLETKEQNEYVMLSVEDSGPGIPESEQSHIFEKFYRLEKDIDLIKGSGLGLYLVKYFIELHGGRVFLESKEGKGTKIGFFLPVDIT